MTPSSFFLLNLSTHWKRGPETNVENTARLKVRGFLCCCWGGVWGSPLLLEVNRRALSFRRRDVRHILHQCQHMFHNLLRCRHMPHRQCTFAAVPNGGGENRLGLDGQIHRLCFGVVDKGDRYWRLHSHFGRTRWEQKEGTEHVLVGLLREAQIVLDRHV